MRALGALGLIVLGVFALIIAQGQSWMVDRDWFTYWAGGRGLLQGANVYDTRAWFALHEQSGSQWFPNPIFIYTPITAIFFAPLAALPAQIAAVVWVWLSASFVALAVIILARSLNWKRLRAYAFYWSLGIVFFLPALLTLLMGQVSALILVLVALTIALWQNDKWLRGGMLLGLTIIKPQPVAILIPMLALWLGMNRRWRALGGLSASLGISAVASFALFPNFLTAWLATATSKVSGVAERMPTLWGLISDGVGSPAQVSPLGAFALMLAIGVCGWTIVRWRAAPPADFISIALIWSVLLTPYLWNYDQILLLIPIWVGLIRLDQRARSFYWIALLPFWIDALAIFFFVIAATRLRDGLSALLTLAVALLGWFALRQTPVAREGQK